MSDATTRAAVISAAGVVLATVLAWWLGRRLSPSQRKSLELDVAQRVANLQETERRLLAERITELETQVNRLKIQYSDGQRLLEQARGENAKLSAEVGNLHAALAAKEVELVSARAQLAAMAAANAGGGETT